MKLPKLLFIVLLILLTSNSNAQNPGFMGKKNSLELGISVIPSIANWNIGFPPTVRNDKNGRMLYYPGFQLKTAWEASYSRTLARNFDLGLMFTYQSYHIYDREYETYNDLGNDLKINSLNIQINSKYYFNSYIAPTGAYINFGLGAYHIVLDESVYIKKDISLYDTKFNLPNINLGIHQKKVFNHGVYGDLGIESNFIVAPKYKERDFFDSSHIYYQNLIRKYINNTNLATIKIAFGVVF